MSREDEMRDLVNRLASEHANRHQLLDSLRQDVQQQRVEATVAVNEMAAARSRMSADLHADLADDLAGRRETVQAMLDTNHAERQDMAAEMGADLTATRQERQQQVTALRIDAREFVGLVAESRQAMAEDLSRTLTQAHVELRSGVHTMLGDFASDRATMSEELRALLEAERKARQQAVADMVANITAMMDQFTVENRAMAAELRTSLATNLAARQQAVAAQLTDIKVKLGQFAAENRAAAAELHAYLNATSATRSAAVAAFMAETVANRQAMTKDLVMRLDHFLAVLEAEVSGTLAGFAAERNNLHASLAELATIWREYTAGRFESPDTEDNSEPVAEELPVSAAPAESDIAVRILSYLATQPEGTRLVDLEPVLGLSRPQIGKYLRHLVDDGKLVKDPETLVYKLA
jgi:hypothetical protein